MQKISSFKTIRKGENMRYLLIGNPNVGKSSIFNLMSESYAHVGNYGGITVEKKIGQFKFGELIDLPGTYSVSPSSEDEGIVTNSLIHENYDGIVNIVDSTHLKRNLHLSIQLLEFGRPIVMALNMMDELNHSGKKIDIKKLSKKLKCHVVGLSARTKEGIFDLVQQLENVGEKESFQLYYGKIIEEAIEQLMGLMKNPKNKALNRWLAIQILEGNHAILEHIEVNNPLQVELIVKKCEAAIIQNKVAFSLKGAIFNYRRDFINNLYNECLTTFTSLNKTKLVNQRIDRWITHPIIGFFIFLFVMFSIYFLTFDFLGNYISDAIGQLFEQIIPLAKSFLQILGAKEDGILMNLIIDGVLAGMSGVLVFVPQIGILFLLLAIIEGTGYMTRVAMMLDTLLSKFGLNGKSIVPLVTGIGCNVPAIMATRTIADKKERLLTILIIPFMSCSARIPVYGLLASIFFEKHRAIVILSMYIIGTVVALASAKILSLSIFKNTSNQFVLEIPPYRIPSGRNVFRQTKLMLMDFIEKAGKFILLGTIVLWFLQYMGPDGIAQTNDTSFLAYIGNFFAPLFQPLGFGTWKAASSLIVGFLAKELIVTSMIVIYGGESVYAQAITTSFMTGISAYSFMVFSLLYLPCLATVGVIHQETKSLRFTLFAVGFTFIIAYIVSFIIYQVGILFI